MRVSLKSNVDLGMESIEIPERSSLRALLIDLSTRVEDLTLIDPRTSDVDDFFVVSLNGQELPFLPDRLETALRDGDQVEIAIISFGGGSQ